LGLFALTPFADLKLNGLTLFKVLEPVTLDVREVNEYVFTIFSRNETVTLLGVEELYGACNSHGFSLSFEELVALLVDGD
jgi:hypothetical protein|tara:strand:- start:227 stop:466 length:240 start_codon:yes stop_codon:yes gene_type:complete